MDDYKSDLILSYPEDDGIKIGNDSKYYYFLKFF